MIDYIIVGLILILLFINIILIILINKNKSNSLSISDKDLLKIRGEVKTSIEGFSEILAKLITEKNRVVLDNVNKNVIDLNSSMAKLITDNKQFNDNVIDRFTKFEVEFMKKYSLQKEEIMDRLSKNISNFNTDVKEVLSKSNESIKTTLSEFKMTLESSISKLTEKVEKNLSEIREDNNKQLDKIKESVNEKLQKTLEDKLKDSFKSVIEGIGSVNQAVGEIKGLASDVGSLKNVLTNVKTKGIMGEVILGNIISEFLTSGQYVENIATKKGSNDKVEFAIILPGNKDEKIYLPIDSKFPYQTYSVICEAKDLNEVNEAKKRLRNELLKYAKEVKDKYIDVPNTTDFAIIFLPLEGLYLEVLNMGLFEEIQKKYKVNITGPTTFTAFINSLNLGFKSLMIEKKSADVFKLLGAVKTEFSKFADTLAKAQKKVNDASSELELLVGTRTRLINSKLKSIEYLDERTAQDILDTENN